MMRVLLVLTIALLSTPAYSDDPATVVPPCAKPARLGGKFDGAPGYFVGFKSTTIDRRAAAAALAKKYDFQYDRYISMDNFIFIRAISPATIAQLRCEADVEYVEFNATTHI
jgi:hypothetical protein